jgi:tetratricopeptide (TPR) repeat protein/CHAT domain-containing protein
MKPSLCRINTRFITGKLQIGLILFALVQSPFIVAQDIVLPAGTIRNDQNVRTLKLGKPIKRELKAGPVHRYGFPMSAGQFLRAVVDQQGIDVVVTLIGPDGKKIVESDSPNGSQGPENIAIIATMSGNHILEIRGLEKEAPKGVYTVSIAELRSAGKKELAAVAARQVFAQAKFLFSQKTKESIEKSIEKYNEALALYQAAGDVGGEAVTENNLGTAHDDLGRKQEALAHYEKAKLLYHSTGDRGGEAGAINNIGTLYYGLGEKRKALKSFLDNLEVFHQINDLGGEAVTLNNIGRIYDDLNNKQQALEYYSRALKIRRDTNNKGGEAVVLNNMGAVYYSTGDKQKALENYQQARDIFQATGDKSREATALNNIGRIYYDDGDNPKAIENYTRAADLYRAVGDQSGTAVVLINVARIHNSTGDKTKAIDNFTEVLNITRDLGERGLEAVTLNGIGAIYDSMDDRKNALERFEKALIIFREIEDRSGEATTLVYIGNVYDYWGQKQKALDYYSQALSLHRDAKDKDGQAITLSNIGTTYSDLGEKKKALEYQFQALAVAREASNLRSEAGIFNNIGAVYNDIGDRQKALEYYFKALALKRKIEDKSGEATALNNIGKTYHDMKDDQTALGYYSQAIKICNSIDESNCEATAYNNIGSSYNALNKPNEALESLMQALRTYKRAGDRSGEATTLNNIGAIYLSQGKYNDAIANFNQALQIHRDVKDILGEAITLNNIGGAYDELGDKQKALDFYTQSLALRNLVDDRFGQAAVTYNTATVYEGLGQKQKALGLYRQSIAITNRLRSAATLEEVMTGLSSDTYSAYVRTGMLLLDIGQKEEAFDVAEGARARTFLNQLGNIRPNIRKGASPDSLQREQNLLSELNSFETRLRQEQQKSASLRDADEIASLKTSIVSTQQRLDEVLTVIKLTNPEYVGIRNVDTLKLADIQKLLTKDTSLVSYFVSSGRTWAFIITRNSFQTVLIPVKEADLRAQISAFRDFADLDDRSSKNLRLLYKWLISPIAKYVTTPVVGIIPNGILHYLPFGALTDGKQVFGDKHTLFYLPSASVLPFIYKKSKPLGTKMLALSQSRVEGMPVLEFADREAQTVAGIFKGDIFLTGQMSKADFIKRVGDYNIIHIAAHARLNMVNPLFSDILLGASRSDENDVGMLSVREVYDLDLSNASLVVLSACETQLGPQSEGDDIVGLNRAFIYAGAPTVVASLWSIDDESTSFLMGAFYSNLMRGMSKAGALQAAQAEIRKTYRNPYYWAGFVLTGDPGN